MAKTAFAGNPAREVDAQKGKAWIRNRIDERSYQRAFLRTKLVIFSAKWNDTDGKLRSCHPRDSIAVQTGAVNEKSGLNLS